jgi:hypothetical protein
VYDPERVFLFNSWLGLRMKKFLVLGLVLAAGWFGYHYISATWNWMQFQGEVDGLLEAPQGLNPKYLSEKLQTKAVALGFDLDPDDLHIRIASADKETTLSGRVAGRGLRAENRSIRLDLVMTRRLPLGEKSYSLERERTFTARLTPSPRENSDVKGAFD